MCKDTNIKLGDLCTNSLQCAKLEAKCRSTRKVGEDGKPEKRCLCFKDMREDSGTGKCVDVKDRGLVPFNRLHRASTWEELNPGRPKRPINRLMTTIKPDEDGLKVNNQ